jgi:uncharacterized protein YbjT (DUF2867 family)
MDVAVLGGTGGLGKLVVEQLRARGDKVRALGRKDGDARDPEVVKRLCDGAGAIVNCAGAAVGFGKGWRGYGGVDTPIGLAAVAAAKSSGARLVYTAVYAPPTLRGCAYVEAHERVVDAMSAIDGVVVRPLGFFSAFASLLPLAKKGLLFDIGSGKARTNPIDERDLAAIIVEATRGDGARDIPCGGPDVMAREDLFLRVGRLARPDIKLRRLPVWLARINATLAYPFTPRLAQFMRFAIKLAQNDAIAPVLGTRRFEDYCAELTRTSPLLRERAPAA